jgi:hypothetical protein
MATLLGLLAFVDPKRPGKEVRTTVAEILDVLEVSRSVAHAVDREWERKKDGKVQRERYASRRFNPSYRSQIDIALLDLFQQSVMVRRHGKKRGETEDRTVHVLETFGYCYHLAGQELDVHALPKDYTRVNVASPDRPVFRLRHRQGETEVDARPVAVMFRFSRELAEELDNVKGTISFTLLARSIFALFRHYHRDAPRLRLLLLILRQRDPKFYRHIQRLIEDLGWDTTHPTRAVEMFRNALAELQVQEIISEYVIDTDHDAVEITPNRNWYQLPKFTGELEIAKTLVTTHGEVA